MYDSNESKSEDKFSKNLLLIGNVLLAVGSCLITISRVLKMTEKRDHLPSHEINDFYDYL